MRRPAVAIAALVAALGAGAAAVALSLDGRAPADGVLTRFAARWSAGDDRAAAALTDRPAQAARQLAASRRGLDGARVRADVTRIRADGARVTGTLSATWRVPAIGAWRTRTRIEARRAGGRWRVRWLARTLHPRLDDDARLGTVAAAPPRGRILDRRGRALVSARPVLHVAIERRRVADPAASAERLAAVLDLDAAALERAIGRTPRDRFLPVITLRGSGSAGVRDELEQVPGISLLEASAPLAPTKAFARALLGVVAPATAEQVTRSRGRLRAGGDVGQWGLQAAFERRLAGTPSRAIVLRDTRDGTVLGTLLRRPGREPGDVRTTLDRQVQAAAERVLGGTRRRAALVAVQPSTGDVLAVANRPGDSSLNRAFTGLYPPGSTFKVVSTAALLREGLRPDETVACPPTRTVAGRAFRNFEGGAAGEVPFRVDFAESCNTAFVGLSERLSRSALTRTARDFGLGRSVDMTLPAADASVPPARDAVGQAAMMIGQDRILASPLHLAGVAATVAAGRWQAPRLVPGDPRRSGPSLPARERRTLHALMRDVVRGGTGEALAGLSGEVAGKSGTAEHGAGDPPPTHAWFIAFRGDLAVSVLVEGGRSGGSVAAPIVARFLSAAG